MSLGRGETELTAHVINVGVFLIGETKKKVSSPIFNAYIVYILFKYYPGYPDTIHTLLPPPPGPCASCFMS